EALLDRRLVGSEGPGQFGGRDTRPAPRRAGRLVELHAAADATGTLGAEGDPVLDLQVREVVPVKMHLKVRGPRRCLSRLRTGRLVVSTRGRRRGRWLRLAVGRCR